MLQLFYEISMDKEVKVKKKTKKRNVTIIVLILLILFGIGLFWLSRHPVVRCYFVPLSNLDTIDTNVYVQGDMVADQKIFLLQAISDAKDHISNLYGEYQASPIIIAGKTMDVMVEYGGNAYNSIGRTYLTAFGAYIVLGPDGISNPDVIAHEMAHAELAHRIGKNMANQLPDWFDEGLALQFDDRFSEADWQIKTENGKNVPSLDEISSIRYDDWLGYATAKHEVGRWLDIVGQDGLRVLLNSLQQGEDFYSTYRTLEGE
jgi:hypothetical protein